MDVVYGALVICGAAYLFSTSTFTKSIKASPLTHLPANLDVRSCEAVEEIQKILTRSGKISDIIIDSMNLMLYQNENPDVDLSLLIPENDCNAIEIGRIYLSKFVNMRNSVMYFFAGVIEMEVEKIRLDIVIPHQDKHMIRKLVDIFYFKELNNNIL
jgi:hypothetical protein